MTTARIILSLLALCATGAAHAQFDIGLGGIINTDAVNPKPPAQPSAPAAIAYNSNPQNIRHIDDVYTLNQKDARITWTDDFAGAAQAGHKVFKVQAFRPEVTVTPEGKAVVSRGEASAKWDYTKTGVRWYAISVFIPQDWHFSDIDMIVGQLHTSQKEAIVSPPVALSIQGKYLKLWLHASELSDKVSPDQPYLEKLTSSEQSIRLAQIDPPEARNRWYCFVMRADWSPTPGIGAFKLWMNGKLRYQAENAFNSYTTWLGNYPKTGLYVPGTIGMPDSQTIYTDYIYLAGAATTDPSVLASKTPCGS